MTITSSSIIKKLLLIFLITAGLFIARDFLIPLTIGALLATLFLPLSKILEKWKLPKIVAIIICLFLLLLFFATIGALIGWQILELANDVDMLKQKSIQTLASIQGYIFNHAGVSVDKQVQFLIDQQQFAFGLIQGMAGSLTSSFAFLALIIVYFVFLLSYSDHIKQFFLKLSSPAQREEMGKVVDGVANVSQKYFLGLSKMIVALWIMYGIGFSALGVKNAVFFAILCGILELAPYIGNIIGVTITVLFSAAQGASFPTLLGIVGLYVVIQLIQGWAIEPFIVGSQVKINPLFTIIALIIGELLWGLPGIFLAIPLVAMVKIVCDHVESLKPYGFLIGEIKKPKK